jgi:hypothetical protein
VIIYKLGDEMRFGAKLSGFLLFILLAPGQGYAADSPPSISVSPASYDFGTLTIEVGSATSIFTISNTGSAELGIKGISIPDPKNYLLDFKAGSKPCGKTAFLTPGESCTFAVLFRPKKEGPLDTKISILSDDPAVNRLVVPLAGFGGICHC